MAWYKTSRVLSAGGGGTVPTLIKDPFDGINATRYNVADLSARSGWYTDTNDGQIYPYLQFKNASGSGHEGICFCIDSFNLTSGTQYKISFYLTAPSGTSWTSSYQYGLKYTSSQVPSASTAFDLTADVNFTREIGTQYVEMTFTASTNNYISFLLNGLQSNVYTWMDVDKIKIEEVTT